MQSLMHVPFVVCHIPHVEVLIITCISLKLIIHSSDQSVLLDQRAIAYPLLLNQKEIGAMHWSEPKSDNKPFVLLLSLDFGLVANDLGYRTSI